MGIVASTLQSSGREKSAINESRIKLVQKIFRSTDGSIAPTRIQKLATLGFAQRSSQCRRFAAYAFVTAILRHG
jgi:hypothetical protein